MSSLIIKPKISQNKITNNVSPYNPGKDVRDRMAEVQRHFRIGQEIMDQPYEEFGKNANDVNVSLIERLNINQRKFNLWRPDKSNDPDLQWHSNALKPIIRNKVVSIVAHVTSQILFPNVIAQNDESEEDKDMAQVMKDAVVWACEQSGYEDKFLDMVQDMCVNPAIILFQDYCEATRTIKEKTKDGGWTLKEVVDEIYSGFITSVVSLDELYIGNIYEPDIQKQPFLIRRKVIDYVAAQRKYGDRDNFKYVQPGIRTFFDDASDTFYEDYDESQSDYLVEEVVYWNRSADLELTIVNGVLMCDPDEPMRRDDKMYPFAKSFYESYNSRFFYGMSLVQKLDPEEDLINTLYRMVIDGTYLSILPPISVYGETDVDAGDFAPRSINGYSDPNVKVEPMRLAQDLGAGYNALQLVETSMNDTSQQTYTPKSDTTAREIAYIEEQTKISLGRTGKMIGKLVKEYGDLLVASILQYMPIAQLTEITGDATRLKFPVLFLSDVEDDEYGNSSKKIEFTNELPEADDEDDLEKMEMEESYKLLEKEMESGMTIVKVRPEAFRRRKYMVKVQPGFISASTKFAKSMMLFDRLQGNPLIDQEKLTMDTVLKELKPGEERDYIVSREDPILREAQKLENAGAATNTQPPTINNAAFTQVM